MLRFPLPFDGPSLRSRVACFALLTLGACSPDSSQDTPGVSFSAIPDDNRSGLTERYERVAAYLTEKLGVPFDYRPSTDYEASVEAFKNGDVQLAWFGGVSGVRARLAVPGSRAIAQGAIDPVFVSYFVAHVSTGLESSETFPLGLRGKTFTFGPRGSTSGRLMPHHFIVENTQESPEQFFGHTDRFTSGHDQTALQVQSGAVDAGALNYKTYERMVSEGTIDPEVCRRIWTTPPYADYNWTAHPALDRIHGPGFVDRLQAVLTSIEDPEVLAALDRREGLVPAKNADYEAIEQTLRSTGMLR